MNVNISGYFIGPTFSGCQKNSFLYPPKMDMLNIQSEGDWSHLQSPLPLGPGVSDRGVRCD